MSSFDDDVDIFEDMEDGTDAQPIQIDSDDSFEAGPCRDEPEPLIDEKPIIDKYQELKEESKRLDEVAVEVRTLLLICKQMEECYSKRVNRKDPLASWAEIRHLHDGTALLLITIHNITDQCLTDWMLCVSPSPLFPHSLASCSQSIPLGTLRPGIQKTFECHVARDFCEAPVILEMALVREFVLDEETRKVFHVAIDPICVTIWDEAVVVKEPKAMNTSVHSSIRLPNPLLDLLSGCPDTIPTPSNVFKALLNLDVPPSESSVILHIPPSTLVKLTVSKDGAAHQSLTIGTESSRCHEVLAEHLRLRLIVEMSKLKSRPGKRGISILAEMEAVSVEGLFQSMLAAFH